MKYHVKAKLVDITEWHRDEQAISGDASHEGNSSVLHRLADEIKDKLEDCTFSPVGLPFEYEFEIEAECEEWLTEDEVKDRVLDEYVEQFCKYDYVKPVDCELEWNIIEEYK